MGFSRQQYWSGLPFPSPEDLPDPGIKPASLKSPALASRFFTTSATCSHTQWLTAPWEREMSTISHLILESKKVHLIPGFLRMISLTPEGYSKSHLIQSINGFFKLNWTNCDNIWQSGGEKAFWFSHIIILYPDIGPDHNWLINLE